MAGLTAWCAQDWADLSDHVRIPCVNQFMKTMDGFTVLPVAVTVEGDDRGSVLRGQYDGQQHGGPARRGADRDALRTCSLLAVAAKLLQKATEEALGTVKKTVDDLLKDMFVGKEKE